MPGTYDIWRYVYGQEGGLSTINAIGNLPMESCGCTGV